MKNIYLYYKIFIELLSDLIKEQNIEYKKILKNYQ